MLNCAGNRTEHMASVSGSAVNTGTPRIGLEGIHITSVSRYSRVGKRESFRCHMRDERVEPQCLVFHMLTSNTEHLLDVV